MKTSAPASASSSEPVSPALFVNEASSRLTGVRSVAVRRDDALAVGHGDVPDTGLHQHLGDGDTGRARRPRSRRAARPSVRPLSRAALRSAASVTTAVPCWSSWKTGMSSRSWSLRSISKHRGAEMSSRFTPPKEGARRTTVSTISSTSVQCERDRHRVDPAELLEEDRLPLHHREGGLGPDVPESEHGRAVRHDGDDRGLPRVVVDELGLLGDRAAHLRDAGRVREGQVVLVADRHGGLHGHLAAAVQRERRVEGVERLSPAPPCTGYRCRCED